MDKFRDEEQRVMNADRRLSCVTCGADVVTLRDSTSELCNACLYLVLFRERFSRRDARFLPRQLARG